MTALDAAIAKLRDYKAATADRDALVREALCAGANVHQISEESGISRPTVYRIKKDLTAPPAPGH